MLSILDTDNNVETISFERNEDGKYRSFSRDSKSDIESVKTQELARRTDEQIIDLMVREWASGKPDLAEIKEIRPEGKKIG